MEWREWHYEQNLQSHLEQREKVLRGCGGDCEKPRKEQCAFHCGAYGGTFVAGGKSTVGNACGDGRLIAAACERLDLCHYG